MAGFPVASKVHWPTKVMLAGVAGAFLWANTKESPLAREFELALPADYGPVAQYLAVRGWPLSPRLFIRMINLSKVGGRPDDLDRPVC